MLSTVVRRVAPKTGRSAVRIVSVRSMDAAGVEPVPVVARRPLSTGEGVVIDVEPSEPISGEKMEFQAETRQLLDIVTNAVYTDRHVFIRELISNASDALEKVRYMQAIGESIRKDDLELAIRIETDEATNTFSISDTGVGMSKDEMVDNIGTIARSGSKQFLQEMGEKKEDVGTSLIGQFGVGFYSSFMVGETVNVESQSGRPEIAPCSWVSKGDGEFTLAEKEDAAILRGTRIVVRLKDDAKEFSNEARVRDVIKLHSTFINFPIYLNGEQVNTVQALWTLSKSDVTDDMYLQFFRHLVNNEYENPQFRLHFRTDAPLDIKALFFVPAQNNEMFAMQRIEKGVSLYSRKVLIEAESGLLPDWLRFVRGVVDSEDIPLAISREGMQDTSLMVRLKAVLTRRVIKWFAEEAKRQPEEFLKFYAQFGNFLKEGACSEFAYQQDIAKLLRFESSALPAGDLTSMDEYVSRMQPGMDKIYYIVAPSRALAEASPYMEAFKGNASEVLFLYSPMDDFVMNNLNKFGTRELLSVEKADIDATETSDAVDAETKSSDADRAADDGSTKGSANVTALTGEQVTELGTWWKEVIPKRLGNIKPTNRLRETPAVVTDHESAAVRRMMRMMQMSQGDRGAMEEQVLPPQTLEVNPKHPIIVKLYHMRHSEPETASLIAKQVFDNSLIAAGLVDDPRSMLPRLNALIEAVLGNNVDLSRAAASDEVRPPPTEAEIETAEADEVVRDALADIDEMLNSGKPIA